PAFTMIPLVGLIIFTNNSNRNLRSIWLWLVPVILIPSIWPMYALYNGQSNLWLQGVISQEYKHDRPLLDSITTDLKLDPVIFVIGMSGLAYGSLKGDVLIILWFIPFLIFLYLIGHVYPFHLIPLLPVLCIASARMLERISNTIRKERIQRLVLLFTMIFGIAEFGLLSSCILLATNVNFSYFRAYADIVLHLPNYTNNENHTKNKVTVIGPNWIWSYMWIPKYVFDKDHYFVFVNPGTLSSQYNQPLKTHKVLFITDDSGPLISNNDAKAFSKQIRTLYNTTKTIATTDNNNTIYNVQSYPYNGMITSTGIRRIEIKSNY
ncbi:MAG: hypothetical protein JO297_09215, partial [Nitrososphaeraceae archaeon]|nr:hypothetical protein [Nitrososphaeraceae archaeon]